MPVNKCKQYSRSHFLHQLRQSSFSLQRQCLCPGEIPLALCVTVLVILPPPCAGWRMERRSSLMRELRLRTLEFCLSTSCGWTMLDTTSVLLPTAWAQPAPLPSSRSSWGRGCPALHAMYWPRLTLARLRCSPGNHLNTTATRLSDSLCITNARQVRARCVGILFLI